MTGSPDRPTQDPLETQDPLDIGGWASRLGGRPRKRYELTNAVEREDHGQESVCYIYPAAASDSELKTRWLAVPAGLLVDLEDAR